MRMSIAAALGVVGGVYALAAFVYLPAGSYWTPDNGVKLMQAENLRFNPWPDLSLDYPGQWLDPDLRFAPCGRPICYLWNGRMHVAQPPIAAILAGPFLPLFGERGGLIAPLLAGLISAGLVGALMQRAGPEPAWLGVLLAGLATPLMFYSVLWWEHTLAVALGLGALWMATRNQANTKIASLIISGGLAGLAASVRKEMLLFALALWLRWLWNVLRSEARGQRPVWTGASAWLGAFALALAPWWWVSTLNSGSLIPPEFTISVAPQFTPQAYLLTHGLNGLADFLFDPRVEGVGNGLLVVVLVYAVAGWVRSAEMRAMIRALAIIALGLGALLLLAPRFPGSGFVGLLSAAPMLMLMLSAPAESRRALSETLWLSAAYFGLVSLNLGLLTQAGPLQSGLEWGMRFALIVFPLCVPLVVAGLRAIREQSSPSRFGKWHWWAACALAAVSVVIQLAGLSEVRDTVLSRRESRDALLALPERQVVSGQFWFTTLSPDVYLEKELFYIASTDTEGLATWIGSAYAHGVRDWAYISIAPLDQPRADALAPAGARLSVVETIRLHNERVITRLSFAPLAP